MGVYDLIWGLCEFGDLVFFFFFFFFFPFSFSLIFGTFLGCRDEGFNGVGRIRGGLPGLRLFDRYPVTAGWEPRWVYHREWVCDDEGTMNCASSTCAGVIA